jgi:Plavaka transposase
MPDQFKDWYQSIAGQQPTSSLVSHCHREVLHEQWRILLSDDLVEAMHHGLQFRCSDGVERMLFPRIFTYSADYPEKYVLFMQFLVVKLP